VDQQPVVRPERVQEVRHTGAFNSVYSAYFTYDAFATTRYTGRRGDHYTVTVGSGENRAPRPAPAGATPPARCRTPSTTSRSPPTRGSTASTSRARTVADPGRPPVQRRVPRRPPEPHLRPRRRRVLRPGQGPHGGRHPRDGAPRHRRRRPADHLDGRALRGAHLQAPAPAGVAAHGHLRGQPVPGVHQRRHRRGAGRAPYSKVKIALAVIAVTILALAAWFLFGSSGEGTGT
jgi:hypothetical protein